MRSHITSFLFHFETRRRASAFLTQIKGSISVYGWNAHTYAQMHVYSRPSIIIVIIVIMCSVHMHIHTLAPQPHFQIAVPTRRYRDDFPSIFPRPNRCESLYVSVGANNVPFLSSTMSSNLAFFLSATAMA